MAITLAKLKSMNQRIAALSRAPLNIFTQLEKLDPTRLSRIKQDIAIALTSAVRRELLITYQRAGLKTKSGALRRALMTATVTPGRKGFVVRLGPGQAENVYARAGVFRYGGVRQTLTKAKGSLYKDLPTGEMRARKKAAGEYGDRAKRTLKKVAAAGGMIGGVVILKPKSPFFKLSPDQVARLVALQDRLISERLGNVGIKVA